MVKLLFKKAIAFGLLFAALLMPVHAGWRDDVGTFRIGILSHDGQRYIPGLAKITKAYQDALGMNVEVFAARDFPSLIEAQAAGRIHYAIYSASAYVVAKQLCDCVEPLVAPVSRNGTYGTRFVLITHNDAKNIATILDGSQGLLSRGIEKYLWEEVSREPSKVKYLASFQEAQDTFVNEPNSALIGWIPVNQGGDDNVGGTIELLRQAGFYSEKLDVIARTPVIRYGPHSIRKDLPTDAKGILVNLLLEMHSHNPALYNLLEQNYNGGFKRVNDEDYAPVQKLLESELKQPSSDAKQ